MKWFKGFVICVFGLVLTSCAGGMPEDAELRLRPVEFSALPGWDKEDHAGALVAFEKSCERIQKQDPSAPVGEDVAGVYADWQDACAALKDVPENDSVAAQKFFETWFMPHAAYGGFSRTGLFTGYYVPELNGSKTKSSRFSTPLYLKPKDLVMVDLGLFRDHLKGERIAGKVKGGRLYPYEDRAEIESGALKGKGLELVWVDDPIGAFFLHVQGSGRVRLDTGEVLRLGYAGQNGHPYYAIGRELVKRGALTRDTVSLQSIRAWLEANPDEAAEVMNLNPSYVFFDSKDGADVMGAEGVPLTPGRSLAVDRTQIPYGVPVWLNAEDPLEPQNDFRQLLVAQDTGGAIRGAVRGDVFFGSGADAALKAGHMKSKGKYWLLLPRHRVEDVMPAAGP